MESDDRNAVNKALAFVGVLGLIVVGLYLLLDKPCPPPLPQWQQTQQVGSPTPISDEHPSLEEEIAAAIAANILPGAVGSPSQDLRAEFTSPFNRTKREVKKERVANGTYNCDGCGFDPAVAGFGQIDEHHDISVKRIFDEGLPHELIYDKRNLDLACRRLDADGHECGCHWTICHRVDGKSNWSTSNQNARADLAKARAKLKPSRPAD